LVKHVDSTILDRRQVEIQAADLTKKEASMDKLFQKHGSPSWAELCTSDMEAAKKFYGPLFGWTFQRFPGGEVPYDMISVGDRMFGGVMNTPKEACNSSPTWINYVTVDNVDETAKNAKDLGGKILMGPRDIPTVGRFCVIQDPQGAVLAAITYFKK
jgi:predicted enzyme related to lactoylglutathione lyase